ncbi:hypothetical protein D9757_005975 [Collybiopsis confluens]|uniref:Uncharacterized protein n=1 Tax=Collybiopsis confluens TaxID=2823264 RepID=A0A8H5MCV6_9AGAR|nr:hypothetical protein D9757_005975 [Collybiopsis confluens]
MLHLPNRRPASPYGLPHPNYALLKVVSPNSVILDSEDVKAFHGSPKQLADSDMFARYSARGGFIEILSLLLLAVLIACMNHILFAHLDGKDPGSHTNQFWVTVLKNMFPAAASFLLFMGLKHCLSQVVRNENSFPKHSDEILTLSFPPIKALHHIHQDSYPLELVNLITSPPSIMNTASVLFNSSQHISTSSFALLAAITQAVALTSLFVPGTMSIVPSPDRTQTLKVPTIDFTMANVSQSSTFIKGTGQTVAFVTPSQRWSHIAMQTALNGNTPTWDPPVGCGSGCSYSFSYFAPALNCTELSKEDIWPSGTNTNTSRLLFPVNAGMGYTFYNSTYSIVESGTSEPLFLEVSYMDNFNTSDVYHNSTPLGQPVNPLGWSPRGVRCVYENATYEARTTFSNSTQVSRTLLKELCGPLDRSELDTYLETNGTAAVNMSMAFLSIVQSFGELLHGSAIYYPFWNLIDTTQTQVLYTPFFTLTTGFGGQGGIQSDFSLSPAVEGNISAGLQDLLGNITLAFVNEQMGTTNVEATVTPSTTQYQYISWRLGLIYGTVFGFSLVVIAYGLFCLRKNGTVAIFDLQHSIVEMTARSTRLHDSVARPSFSSTLVKGVFMAESDGARRRGVVLDV